MIYCNACGLPRGWPQDLMPAKGSCELCGQRKVCNHVQSSMLPLARV
jgi:hypothetical protein